MVEKPKMIYDMSIFYYDYGIMPRFEEEWDNRLECAEALKKFLDRMGLSFEEFYDLVLDYSLGNGLQYMREVNDMIPLLSPIMNRNELEMDLSFHENCVPGAAALDARVSPLPILSPL